MISLVPLSAIDQVWPAIGSWVERACLKARSNRTAPEVYQMIRNGACWLALALSPDGEIVGCTVMQIYEVQGERVLQHVIVASAGSTDEWFAELLHWDWIEMMGVKRVVCEGRPGWPERLKHIVPGLRTIRVQFEWEHPAKPEQIVMQQDNRPRLDS